MSEQERGTDRAGRRRKRFLTPQEKYEIWIQLVRHEATIAEAADKLLRAIDQALQTAAEAAGVPA